MYPVVCNAFFPCAWPWSRLNTRHVQSRNYFLCFFVLVQVRTLEPDSSNWSLSFLFKAVFFMVRCVNYGTLYFRLIRAEAAPTLSIASSPYNLPHIMRPLPNLHFRLACISFGSSRKKASIEREYFRVFFWNRSLWTYGCITKIRISSFDTNGEAHPKRIFLCFVDSFRNIQRRKKSLKTKEEKIIKKRWNFYIQKMIDSGGENISRWAYLNCTLYDEISVYAISCHFIAHE